ncbi:arsenate reductase [Falsiroseomonas stagni]|uniref:Transcriptional regulator, Spx/MgsR family n=1 Tax=Falsiroseomonas stagni DSM 19981 TaxID=1123062 RepID=A0A1I4B9G2_9PROT|nr:arsenate reductase [Falsiroseomonas stagni]SFK65468.1 transcriptional regulator, Spx/MgsR family [Falsiroseomonas stagni DSM 19981]
MTESRAVTIHGIKNCDTMKKARAWLEQAGIDHRFRDYKAEPPRPEEITRWAGQVGWEALLNRAGTTFRKLPEAEREGIDQPRAIALMLAQPSVIKRPVLEIGDRVLVGFKPEEWAKALG